MIEEVKQAIRPVLPLIKDLNNQVKVEDLDPDTLVKLAATMKFSSLKIEKILKQNKLSSTGGVSIPAEEKEEE